MSTTLPHSKNISFLCHLDIGETIIIKDWGYKLDGEHIIEDIKTGQSESGVLIKISGYDSYIDSSWATKK